MLLMIQKSVKKRGKIYLYLLIYTSGNSVGKKSMNNDSLQGGRGTGQMGMFGGDITICVFILFGL